MKIAIKDLKEQLLNHVLKSMDTYVEDLTESDIVKGYLDQDIGEIEKVISQHAEKIASRINDHVLPNNLSIDMD